MAIYEKKEIANKVGSFLLSIFAWEYAMITILLLAFVAVSLLMESCHTFCSPFSNETERTGEKNSTEINYILSDSINKIIMQASYIRFYQMEGFFSDSTHLNKSDSLLNYVIKTDYNKLNKKEKELLYFALGDGRNYRKNYAPIRQPFRPNFALVFVSGKQFVYFLASLGTGEVAIVDEKANFFFFLLKDANIIERWYDYVLSGRK